MKQKLKIIKNNENKICFLLSFKYTIDFKFMNIYFINYCSNKDKIIISKKKKELCNSMYSYMYVNNNNYLRIWFIKMIYLNSNYI